MNIERCTGIYGIYVNDELVYIGKTLNSFATSICPSSWKATSKPIIKINKIKVTK